MTPPGSGDALRRIDALVQVGLRLARSAPSGRVLLAQLALGLDARLVPRPWGDDLLAAMDAAAAASAEPLSRRTVERALQHAWGVKPAVELDDLDPEPVATTPTSQVHRAQLDGRPVAVKLQRPGLAAGVRQDLALLDALREPLAAAFPALDAAGVLREVGERVRDEFDLEHEAQNARALGRRFRDDPRLRIPAPVTRLSAEDVLVREWVDGHPLDDPAVTRPQRDAAATDLVHFTHDAAGSGFMNCGLTPADVLIADDGRTAVLDHGVCATVDPDRVRLAVAAATAVRHDDAARLIDALAQLRWLTDPALARDAHTLAHTALGDLLGEPTGLRLDVDAVRAAGARLDADDGNRRQIAALVRAGALAPADLWPMRGVLQLTATITHVGATVAV